MNKKAHNHTVAECCRIEFDENSGQLYIVFLVTDEDLKKSIKKDWTQDIEFIINNRKLIKEEE